MSPHVGNFVADLVEMAKATEQLPKVQAELADARKAMDEYLSTIQRLEAKLMDRANEINGLNARIQALEVSRDDAELRFLEADDKLSRVLGLVRGMGETLGQVVAPVKAAEPEVNEVPVDPTSASVPSSSPPSHAPSVDTGNVESETSASPLVTAEPYSPPPASWASPAEPEVSPADPTAPSTAGDGHSPGSVGHTSGAEPTPDASSAPVAPVTTEPVGAFAGKNWSEVCNETNKYISHSEWIAGGGDEYGWRN